MDQQHFDHLTRALSGATSRRQALKLLGGSVAGGLLAFLGVGKVDPDDRFTVRVAPFQALADDRPTHADIDARTVVLLPTQAADYRYRIIPVGDRPPDGFAQRDFREHEAGFAKGKAAFGAGGGSAPGGRDCPLHSRVRTNWPLDTELLLRQTVFIPQGASNVRIMISVDNDVLGVFFNGRTLITEPILHDNCPIEDEFRIDVPDALIKPGWRLNERFVTVAFHVRDVPGPGDNESFFDAQILANLTPTELDQAIEELLATVTPMVQREPITDITTNCDSTGDPKSITVAFRVARTGETGEVRIEQAADGQGSIGYLVNGEPLSSVAAATRAGELELTIRGSARSVPTSGRMAIDPAVSAFGTALSDPSILQRVEACLHTVDASAPCSTQCGRIADSARTKITAAAGGLCAFGAVIFGGLIGGSIGGPAGVVLGGAGTVTACIINQYQGAKDRVRWDDWEDQCKECCAIDCDVAVCTSNQPIIFQRPVPQECKPPDV